MFQSVLKEHIAIITALKNLENEISNIGLKMVECLQHDGKILLMGNGGSAADAQHIAAEIVVRYQKNRRALPAIALTTDTSILTATGNDFSFKQIFSRQIEALAEQKDIIIGISTSGESENVILAFQVAKEKGANTILLTGKKGGTLAKISDHTIKVPSNVTARIQEAHILIGHFLCEYIESKF